MTTHLVVTPEIRKRMVLCQCEECKEERFGRLDDSDLIGLIEGALTELSARGYRFTDDTHDEQLFFARNGMMQ